MFSRTLTLTAAVAALSLSGAAPALAHGPGPHDAGPAAPSASSAPDDAAPQRSSGRTRYFTAQLSGDQEVPAPGGPAVGDDDGRGEAIVAVRGTRITFAVRYEGIGAPTLGHIHRGKAGANGAVVAGLFTSPLPGGVEAAAGTGRVESAATADGIRANPGNWYVNLHSAEFPGGAIRGQLRPARRLDVLDLVDGGTARAFLSGDEEVPVEGGPAVGDPDARAVATVRPRGGSVGYSLAWLRVDPTLGHIHRGAAGVNGPVAVPLFTDPVPGNVIAVSGTAEDVDPAVVAGIREKPRNWYVNLHSAQFPGGAVRGQLR